MLLPIGNKRIKQKKDAFLKLVAQNKDKKWFVCSHDNPDPDSMGSVFGMQHILQFLGVENVEMLYCGDIDHPQNVAMRNILDIQLHKWNKSPESEDVYVFLDCMPSNKNMSITNCPLVVIDHHKTVAPVVPNVLKNQIIIRDDVGSCSTLITDLVLSLSSPESEEQEKITCLDPDDEHCRDVATALALGIKIDTLDFRSEGTTEEDFKAYKTLSTILDEDKFEKIVNYQFPPYIFEYEQIAWQNKNLNQPNLITGLGFVKSSQANCIPTIADRFTRLEGVQTVVVFAIAGNMIRGSVRTSSASIDTQTLCNEIFGEGNGGARHGVGGSQVPLTLFDVAEMNQTDKDKLWELVKTQIENRFTKAISR